MTRLQSIELLGFRDNLHVAHWQAPRKTNEHATLGDLYEAVLGKVDELTELAIARDGGVEFPQSQTISIINRVEYPDLLAGGLLILTEIRATLKAGADDDMLNIIADLAAAIRRAAYKLEIVLP